MSRYFGKRCGGRNAGMGNRGGPGNFGGRGGLRGPQAFGRPGLYRARDGIIMGVCKGFARYFDISVFAVRAVVVLLFLFTGLWPVAGFYFLAAFLMKPEPVAPLGNDAEREFYETYANSRTMAVSRLKRKFETLDRRLQRMEDTVTSRDFDWQRRFNQE